MEQRRRLSAFAAARDKHERAREPLRQSLAEARRGLAERAAARERATRDRDDAQAAVQACDGRIAMLKAADRFQADGMAALQRYRADCAENETALQAEVRRSERAEGLARRHMQEIARQLERNHARIDAYERHIGALRGALASQEEARLEEQAEEAALAKMTALGNN